MQMTSKSTKVQLSHPLQYFGILTEDWWLLSLLIKSTSVNEIEANKTNLCAFRGVEAIKQTDGAWHCVLQ